MNSEQEKELLDYLISIGFTGGQLAEEINEKQERNLPAFKVKYGISYGDEQMIFDLQFRRDHQFNAYRLEEYEATYRKPVVIEPAIINGVDTVRLEEQMKAVDWNNYFKTGREALPPETAKQIGSIMDDLLKLEANNNASGWNTQRMLQYKYWPETAYDSSSLSFKREFEQQRTFSPHENGICNANLAYHITSGRLDDLCDKLEKVGLNQYPGIDIYLQLEKIVSDNPEKFTLKFSRNEPEGYMEYDIPVIKIDGWYSVDTYTTILTPYPPIEHGYYNGIDTRILEGMMREIDWHDDDQLFIFHEDSEPEFQPKVADVQDQIYRLSQDMAGGEIADKLQLKYWADATFFSDMLQQTAWDYLDELPKREQVFPVEANSKAAFNLLAGRAVMEQSIYPFDPQPDCWIRLDLNAKVKQGYYPKMPINGFNNADLENLLTALPIYKARYYPALNGLKNGDLAAVILKGEKKVLIEANPEQRTINIYSIDMRPIPVNLHFDPDWKPGTQEEKSLDEQIKTEQTKQKYPRPKPMKRDKGKWM